jgi:hypothetical protein
MESETEINTIEARENVIAMPPRGERGKFLPRPKPAKLARAKSAQKPKTSSAIRQHPRQKISPTVAPVPPKSPLWPADRRPSQSGRAKKAAATAKTVFDQQRAPLVAALAAVAKAKEAVIKQKAAIDRLQRIVWNDPAKVAAAETAIQKAGERLAVEIGAAHAAGDEVPTSSGVRKARAALVDAQDEEAANKIALAKLRDDFKDLEAEARECEVEVEKAISAILEPLASQLLARTRKLVETLQPYTEMLAALHFESDRPSTWDGQRLYSEGHQPLEDMRKLAGELLCTAKSIFRAQPDPWVAARKALRENPNDKLEALTTLIGVKQEVGP